MTQRRIFWNRKTVAVAASLVAGLSLTTTGVLVRADRDDRSRDLRDAIDGGRAKNVILFLGDGMGDSEITDRAQLPGRRQRPALDGHAAAHRRVHDLRAAGRRTPSLIDYVTDSAASGTGWATGFKTSNGRISSVAGTGAAVTRLQHDPRARAAGRLQDRQRQHGRAHRRHAGGARLAHQRPRLPGSGGHGQLRARRRRKTADPDRSPSSRSITTSTCCSAAASRASSR